MGTNYYIIPRGPARVIFPNDIHIGKKSAGWSFSFRGYTNGHTTLSLTRVEEYDNSVVLLLNERREIKSRGDWLDVLEKLTTRSYRVFFRVQDEYGVVVANPLEWCANLDVPTDKQFHWEKSRAARGHHNGEHGDNLREWHDAERFRFYDGEFS